MSISLTRPKRMDTLSCVNAILKAAGEDEVSSIETGATESAIKAADHLAAWSLNIQGEGYNFCTEPYLTLEPDTSGNIYLPENLLTFKPTGASSGDSLQDRGGRLYDAGNSTFTFNRKVYLSAVMALPFDQLPQAASWYITNMAAISYINGMTPGDASLRTQSEVLKKAKIALERYDNNISDKNLKSANPHFVRMRRKTNNG